MKKWYLIICVFICTFSQGRADAQVKSVGATFCYAGTGISYEHSIDEGSFMEFQLRMETSSVFGKKKNSIPGVSASFSWNMIFAETESCEGNRVVFFAGPGAIVGWSEDMMKRTGLVFGLKGRVGGECTFIRRNVSISLSLSPVIGLHMSARNGMMDMLLYKTGLLYGIMPEVGIKYAF